MLTTVINVPRETINTMKYRVERAITVALITDRVQESINSGWIPQGGICVDRDNYYWQAMILPKQTLTLWQRLKNQNRRFWTELMKATR